MLLRYDKTCRTVASAARLGCIAPAPLAAVGRADLVACTAASPETRLVSQVRRFSLTSDAAPGPQLLARGSSTAPIDAVVHHLQLRVAPMSAATITADSQLEVLESSFRLLGIAHQALKAEVAALPSTLSAGDRAALCRVVAALLQLAREAASGRVSERSASKSGVLSRTHRQLQELPPHGSLAHLCLAVEVAAQVRSLMLPPCKAPSAGAASSTSATLSLGRSNASLYRDVAVILAGLLRSDPTLRDWLQTRPTLSSSVGAARTTGLRKVAPDAASVSRDGVASIAASLSPIAAWNSCFRMLQLLKLCDPCESGFSSIAEAAARSISVATGSTAGFSLVGDAATTAGQQEGIKIAGALHQSMALLCSGMVLAIHRGALGARCCVYADADGNARRPSTWRRKGTSPASFLLPTLQLLNASRLRCAALVAAALPHLRADASDIQASAALWYDAAVTATDGAVPTACTTSAPAATAVAAAADVSGKAEVSSSSAGSLSAATSSGRGSESSAAPTAPQPAVLAPYHAAPFPVLQRRLDHLLSVITALRQGQDVVDGRLLAAAMRAAVACARAANHAALTEAPHAGQLRASATAVLQSCMSLAPDWQALHPRHWAAGGAPEALALQLCREEARDWLVVSSTLAAADVQDAAAELGLQRDGAVGCAAGAGATGSESKAEDSSVESDQAAAEALDLPTLSLSRALMPRAPHPPRLQAVHLAAFLTYPRGKVYTVHRGKELRLSIAHQAAEASALVNALRHPSVVAAVSTLHSILLAASTDVYDWTAGNAPMNASGSGAGSGAGTGTGKGSGRGTVVGTGTGTDDSSKRRVPRSSLLPPAEALHAARPLLRSVVGLLRRAVELDKLTAEGRLAPRRFAAPGSGASSAGAAVASSAGAAVASSAGAAVASEGTCGPGAAAGGSSSGSAATSSAGGSRSSARASGDGLHVAAGGADVAGAKPSAAAEWSSCPTPLLGASARRPDAGSIIYARIRPHTSLHHTSAALATPSAAAAAGASSSQRRAERAAAQAAMAASLARTRRYARNAIANLQGVLAWLVANRCVEPGVAPLSGRYMAAKAKANEEEAKQLQSESGPLWPLWMHSLVNMGAAHRSMLRCRADVLAADAAAAAVAGAAAAADASPTASAAVTGPDATTKSAAASSSAVPGPYDFELDDDRLEGHSAAEGEGEGGGEHTVRAAAAVLRASPSGGILCPDLVSRDGAALRELATAAASTCSKHEAPIPSVGTWSYELAAPSLLRLGGPEQPHLVEVLGRSAFLLAHQREAAALARRDAQLTMRAAEAAAAAQWTSMRSGGPSGGSRSSNSSIGSRVRFPHTPWQEPLAVLAPAGSSLPQVDADADAEVVRNRLFQLLRPAAVARIRSLRVCRNSVHFVTLAGSPNSPGTAVDAAGGGDEEVPLVRRASNASASSAFSAFGGAAAASSVDRADLRRAVADHEAARLGLRAEFAWQLTPWALTMHRRVERYREAEKQLAVQRRRSRQVAFAGGEGPEVHDAALQRPEQAADAGPRSRQRTRRSSPSPLPPLMPPPSRHGQSSATSTSSRSAAVTTASASERASRSASKASKASKVASDAAGAAAPQLAWGASMPGFGCECGDYPLAAGAGASLTRSAAAGTGAAQSPAASARSSSSGKGAARAASPPLALMRASGARHHDGGPFDESDVVDVAVDVDGNVDVDLADIVDVVDVTDVTVPPRERWGRGGGARALGRAGGAAGGDDEEVVDGWGDEGEGGEGAEGHQPQQLPRPRPAAARKLHLPSSAYVSADMRRAAEAQAAAAFASGAALGDEFDAAGWSDDDNDHDDGGDDGGGGIAASSGAASPVFAGRRGGASGTPPLPPRQLA